MTCSSVPSVRAAAKAAVTSPVSALGRRTLRWGDQLDIRPILLDRAVEGLSEQAVAGYIAKYATKGAEDSGTIDHRVVLPGL
ncbi:replication initiator [Acrocarpospora macrocephala]|nr:replication initiator [Acrocarpospora macrocephala]